MFQSTTEHRQTRVCPQGSAEATSPRSKPRQTGSQRLRKSRLSEENSACPHAFRRLQFPYDMTETKPQNRRLGYARVSTYGQTLDAQLEQLRAHGCEKIFREKVTGARADRRELLKLLKALTPATW